jgi:NADH-quinone oxidoreductase subunit N
MMNPIFLIAFPLLAAFLSILSKRIAPVLLIVIALLNTGMAMFIPMGLVGIGGFSFPYGINLYVDTYAQIGLILVNGLFTIIAILNITKYKVYSSVLLVALTGLNGLLLTGDLFNLFVFLEISGIAAYLITSSNKKPLSTFHYLVMGSVGSSLYLFGLIILYSMFGTLNFMDMIHQIQVASIDYSNLILPFFMMFIGLGVEAKLLPFNSWVRGVLKHSNTLSGPMVAGVYAAAISLVLGRLIHNLFLFEGKLYLVVVVLLVLGIVLGEAMAFSSDNVKEILLYSSISQACITALLFVHGVIIWAVYLIIANGIAKTLMFLVVNKASEDSENAKMDNLQGLFANNKVIGIAFTFAALSLIGMPLFAGFIIKMNYLTVLVHLDQLVIIAVILLSSIVEGIYFIRLLIKFWYPGDHEIQPVKFHLSYKIILGFMAAALLVFGTYSTPLNKLNDSIDQVSEEIEVIFHG